MGDTRFDIDAKFAHLEKIGELGKELEWHFCFRSTDLEKLERIAESLGDEFEVGIQEEVPTIEDGREFMGPPMLTVTVVGELKPVDAKALAARFEALAKEQGITYDGVDTFEPVDMEEMFGWLDLEGAIWRLRHYTDTGLQEGAEMPWTFCVSRDGVGEAELKKFAAKLPGGWFEESNVSENEEGRPELVLFCAGTNDDAALTAKHGELIELTNKFKLEVIGIQFFEPGDDEPEMDDDEE